MQFATRGQGDVVVAALTLALLIPLGMINGTIKERINYRQQAVTAVAESFAGPQVLAGPVLVVPYTEVVQVQDKDAFGKPVWREWRSDDRWTMFPDAMSVQGKLVPAIRKRGLHEVRVYEFAVHAALPISKRCCPMIRAQSARWVAPT